MFSSFIYKKLFYLLLICFSLSVLGLAFHHHWDGFPHGGCPLCSHALGHSLFILQDSPQISLLSSDVLFISVENAVSISYLRYHSYSNRAPPA
jgi:hypothetical protein